VEHVTIQNLVCESFQDQSKPKWKARVPLVDREGGGTEAGTCAGEDTQRPETRVDGVRGVRVE